MKIHQYQLIQENKIKSLYLRTYKCIYCGHVVGLLENQVEELPKRLAKCRYSNLNQNGFLKNKFNCLKNEEFKNEKNISSAN